MSRKENYWRTRWGRPRKWEAVWRYPRNVSYENDYPFYIDETVGTCECIDGKPISNNCTNGIPFCNGNMCKC